MIRPSYSSLGPKRLLFTLNAFTKQDIRLKTLTNNFWLLDNNKFLEWRLQKKKTCNKFLLHQKMCFTWILGEIQLEKSTCIELIWVNFMQIAYSRIFLFFFFYMKFICGTLCECAFHMKFMWGTICCVVYAFEAYLLSKWTASIKAEEILLKMTEMLYISCKDWSDIRWRHIFWSVSWSIMWSDTWITWSLHWPVGTP